MRTIYQLRPIRLVRDISRRVVVDTLDQSTLPYRKDQDIASGLKPIMASGEYWNLRVDRQDRVFVITMQKAPENRLSVRFAQEIIRALRDIERELGPDSDGCVIIKGNDEKFWCTGLDLDEVEANPFANSDGFYPVSSP